MRIQTIGTAWGRQGGSEVKHGAESRFSGPHVKQVDSGKRAERMIRSSARGRYHPAHKGPHLRSRRRRCGSDALSVVSERHAAPCSMWARDLLREGERRNRIRK